MRKWKGSRRLFRVELWQESASSCILSVPACNHYCEKKEWLGWGNQTVIKILQVLRLIQASMMSKEGIFMRNVTRRYRKAHDSKTWKSNRCHDEDWYWVYPARGVLIWVVHPYPPGKVSSGGNSPSGNTIHATSEPRTSDTLFQNIPMNTICLVI